LSVLAFQFDRPMTLVSLSAILSDFDSIVSEKKRLIEELDKKISLIECKRSV